MTPTDEARGAIYALLREPFPEEAIERTYTDDRQVRGPDGRMRTARGTRKGYDTTGIKYQAVADRLTEACGLGGWRTEPAYTMETRETGRGSKRWLVYVDLVLTLGSWDAGAWVPWAEARSSGGHEGASPGDARKGAFTNALKKAAAMFGCGREAYLGTLDDDHVPAPHEEATRQNGARAPQSPRDERGRPDAGTTARNAVGRREAALRRLSQLADFHGVEACRSVEGKPGRDANAEAWEAYARRVEGELGTPERFSEEDIDTPWPDAGARPSSPATSGAPAEAARGDPDPAEVARGLTGPQSTIARVVEAARERDRQRAEPEQGDPGDPLEGIQGEIDAPGTDAYRRTYSVRDWWVMAREIGKDEAERILQESAGTTNVTHVNTDGLQAACRRMALALDADAAARGPEQSGDVPL